MQYVVVKIQNRIINGEGIFCGPDSFVMMIHPASEYNLIVVLYLTQDSMISAELIIIAPLCHN